MLMYKLMLEADDVRKKKKKSRGGRREDIDSPEHSPPQQMDCEVGTARSGRPLGASACVWEGREDGEVVVR